MRIYDSYIEPSGRQGLKTRTYVVEGQHILILDGAKRIQAGSGGIARVVASCEASPRVRKEVGSKVVQQHHVF